MMFIGYKRLTLMVLAVTLAACGGGGGSGSGSGSDENRSGSSQQAVESGNVSGNESGNATDSGNDVVTETDPSANPETVMEPDSESAPVGQTDSDMDAGSDDNSDSATDSVDNGGAPIQLGGDGVGYFIDSAVYGLSYKAFHAGGNVTIGITGPNGEYQYEEGRGVEFSLGDLIFGRVPGSGLTTPFSFVDDELHEDYPINIVRLLLTLDADGDASNGIEITTRARFAFMGLTPSIENMLDEPGDVFENYLVAQLNSALPEYVENLVSESEARAHVSASLAEVDYQIDLPGTAWRTVYSPKFYQYWNEANQSWAHIQACNLPDYGVFSEDSYDETTVTTYEQRTFEWLPQCDIYGPEVALAPRDYDEATLCGYKLADNPNADLTACTYADLNSKRIYTDSLGRRFTRYVSHTPFSGVVTSVYYLEYDIDGITVREKWSSVATQM